MTLVKVARPRINRSIDNLLNSVFDEFNVGHSNYNVWRPAMNVQELEKEFIVSFSLPGFEKDEFNVSVKNNMLTLKAEKAAGEKEEEPKFLIREIAKGSFERSIELPENVNPDKISAEYKSGILTLSIPKTKEALPKEIAVTIK